MYELMKPFSYALGKKFTAAEISALAPVIKTSLEANWRICCAAGSMPREARVTSANAQARNERTRRLSRRRSEPQGPRLASSYSWKWARGRGCKWKCRHFSWLRHVAAGTSNAAFPIVVKTAMSEFGWMGSLQSDSGRLFVLRRMLTTRHMLVMLSPAAPTSHHHQ